MNVGLWVPSFLILEGLKSLIHNHGWQISWESTNDLPTLEMKKIDLVVVYSGNRPNEQVFRQLRSSISSPAVLILGYNDYVFKSEIQRYNIKGILTPLSCEKYIKLCLDSVITGNTFIEPSVTVHAKDLTALTEREYEVFELFGMGQRVKEVAQTLGLSDKTVSTHRIRILRKLGLKTTAQLIHYHCSLSGKRDKQTNRIAC